jgi:hypothetical protein
MWTIRERVAGDDRWRTAWRGWGLEVEARARAEFERRCAVADHHELDLRQGAVPIAHVAATLLH